MVRETNAPGNQTRSTGVLWHDGPSVKPGMPRNLPCPLRSAKLHPTIAKSLFQAFRAVLGESIPDRFLVLCWTHWPEKDLTMTVQTRNPRDEIVLHLPALRTFALRLARSPDLADGLVQDIIEKA